MAENEWLKVSVVLLSGALYTLQWLSPMAADEHLSQCSCSIFRAAHRHLVCLISY